MKRCALFHTAVLMFATAPLVWADLPPAKDPLRQPAIILPETPAEWIEMYCTAQKNPAGLLCYLREHVAFMSERKQKSFSVSETTPGEKEQLGRRWYALTLLGDTAGSDIIPAIEEFIAARKAQGDTMTDFDVALAEVVIERIQLRVSGRDTYIATMLDWVRNGDKTYPRSVDERGQPTRKGKMRVWQAAWALGQLRVPEAAPVLEAKTQEPLWSAGMYGFPLIRALAQIGDRNTMKTVAHACYSGGLFDRLFRWNSLCPGEVDPVWTYWQMRTQGMSLPQTIETMLGALGGDELDVYAHKVLEALGDTSVPYLIDALQHPRGKDPIRCLRIVALVVGNLRARQAVEPLRGLLKEALGRGDIKLGIEAAIALGKIGDPSALPELLSAAQSTDFYLQASAIRALGYLGDPRAEPLLLELLTTHPEANIRYGAAEALRTVGTASAIPVLEQRLQVETDRGTRGQIGTTLQTLRQKVR